jgi:hypothetical protein
MNMKENKMEPSVLLSSAIDKLNQWKIEEPEDMTVDPMINILEYASVNLQDRKQPHVRNAIALAYAILGSE